MAFAVLYNRLSAAGDTTLQFWFNSDYLFAAGIYRDVLIDHFPLSGIKFSIAPCIFPDVVFTSILMMFTSNAIVATFLYGLFQFALLVTAFLVCAKVTRFAEPGIYAPCILLAATAITLSLCHTIATEPVTNISSLAALFITESHVSSFALVVLAAGLALWLCWDPPNASMRRRLLAACYTLICLLATLSDLMFVPQMVMALTLTVCIACFFRLIPWAQGALPLVLGWTGTLLGWPLTKVLVDSADPAQQTGLSVERFISALHTFINGAINKFAEHDELHISAALWIACSLIFLVIALHRIVVTRTARTDDRLIRTACLFLFLLLSALASTSSILLFGVQGLSEFKDYTYSMHYQYPLFFGSLFGWALLAAFGLSPLLRRVHIPPTSRIRWGGWAVPGLVLVVYLLGPANTAALGSYTPPLVRFLDEQASQYHLHYGVAGFWQARWITLLSHSGLRAYPVTSSLDPFHWLGNKYWYRGYPASKYPTPVYDFLLLDDPLFKISREAAVQRFGEPAAELRIQGTRILIYNRPQDQRFRNIFLCNSYLSTILTPLDRPGNRIDIPGACLPGLVGSSEQRGRSAHNGTAPGYLSFGPYLALKHGGYHLTLRYTASTADGSPAGTWDVGYFSQPPAITLESGALPSNQQQLDSWITVDNATEGKALEMRTVYAGKGDLLIRALSIQKDR